MGRICKTKNDIRIFSHASVGGKEEREGPLGKSFDFCDESDLFGQRSFELAEGEMGRIALNTALSKKNLSHTDMSGFNTNSIVVIKSKQIAGIYKKEFEQMYNGKFHTEKEMILNILTKNNN